MMENIIYLLVGFFTAGLITWFLASFRMKSKMQAVISEKDSEINDLRVENGSLKSKIQSGEESLKKAEKALLDTFKAAASDALTNNNKQFLELAKSKLETQVKEAEGDLDERKSAIEEMLKPLQNSIENYKKRIEELEKGSEKTFGSVSKMLESLQESQKSLQQETGALVTALKNPRVRGKWGEIGLKRVVEFSGMSEYCDFDEQVSKSTDDGRLRPDMVVNLPGKRHIVVDSKLPLNAYLEALETDDDTQREVLLAKHAKALRDHMNQLSKKQYWSQFEQTPDFVICYVEVESAFSAAMFKDRLLIQDGINNRIIFATPTTLIAILRSVAMSWQQHKITINAREISNIGKELFERLSKFADNLNRVGKGLNTAIKGYNDAVGSWDSRVVPSGKRMKELNATIVKELPELEHIDTSVREPKQIEE